MDNALARSDLQVLQFLIANVRMCIDLQSVIKVLSLTQLERIPNGPSYVAGVLNLAGKGIPIIDLSLRLGLRHENTYTIDTPILICSNGEHQAGFIVDKVIGLARIDNNALQMQDDFNAANLSFYAAVTINGELSLYIRIESMLMMGNPSDSTTFYLDEKLLGASTVKYE